MTEKRFVEDHSYLINYDKYCILDKVQNKHLYLDEVIDLLNEQQAIIQKEMDEKINVQERLSYMIRKYNQLKQQNFYLQVKLSEQKKEVMKNDK